MTMIELDEFDRVFMEHDKIW